ncbi:TonB family protein [Marinicauda sp. Alg238-R41]|uniref:TonB family protein n=1 Tax=Marinicauda sp. Alg238-R41 TaxID=2993447 RepID=UPI0022E17CD3|nr:TonB family protein [Marinicauda sp. Alg238-R41]
MRYLLIIPLVLAACAQVEAVSPLADPRERGPFIARSDFPNPPNVERAASGAGCSGEPLRAVAAPMPEYPARGWSRGLQGWSIVQFDVAQAGTVENVRIARGVPGGSFDHEAQRAVEGWRFQALSEGAYLSGCVVLFEFKMGEVTVR